MPVITDSTNVRVHTNDAGGVEVAVDHPDALWREVERVTTGDDAAAIVHMSADDAVRLAFELLAASGRDPVEVMGAILGSWDRRSAVMA